MLVGYMRVSSADDRQSVDLQRDALIAAGVDERHLYMDKASGARDDRPGLKAASSILKAGDMLVVWKLDRLGRSLLGPAHHRGRPEGPRRRVPLADRADGHHHAARRTPVLDLRRACPVRARADPRARHRRARGGKRRGRKGGRPPSLDPEKVEQIIAALEGGASKASVCRTFKVPRSTLLDTLARVGWTGAGAGVPKVKRTAPKKVA